MSKLVGDKKLSIIAKYLASKELELVPNKTLGTGAFGKVYLTKYLNDRQLYAVKIINIPEYLKFYNFNPLYIKIFQLKQEVCEFLAQFINPVNVISYKDCWYDGPEAEYYKDLERRKNYTDSETEDLSFHRNVPEAWLCIRMNYCESDLRKWLNKNNTLKLRQPHVASLLEQILKGLEYIHRQGVIHRDIKPSNILIKELNGDFVIQIGDFGLATKSDAKGSECRPVGTKEYMSPEMMICKKTSDFNCKTDIYAAGLILLELVTLSLDTKDTREKAFQQIRDGSYNFSNESWANELIKLMTMKDFSRGKRPSATRALSLLHQKFPKLRRKGTEDCHSMQNESLSSTDLPKTSCSNAVNKNESFEGEIGLSNAKSLKWPLKYNISEVNENFVGRAQELSQLEQIYTNKSNKIVVISGLVGIGKSELAKNFAHFLFQKGNINCTWFNAETNYSLQQSLVGLAEQLKIRRKDSSNQTRANLEIVQDLLNAVDNNEESQFWLLILDNVDSLSLELKSILRMLNKAQNILIILTTRNIGIVKQNMRHIPLNPWTLEDGIEFIKKSLNILENELNDAEKLCSKLGNHCLAMNQAVAYISHEKNVHLSVIGNCYGISNYLAKFDLKAEELLRFKNNKIVEENEQATFITWDITFQKLDESYGDIGKQAREIMDVLVYCDPNGIPLDFISKIYQNDRQLLIEALELLKKYSLITSENSIVSIHPLLQLVIRFEHKYLNKRVSGLTALLNELRTLTYSSESEINHEISIWNHASEETELVKTFSNIPNQISWRLHELGFYSKLLEFSEENSKKLAAVLGEDSSSSLDMKHIEASALRKKGEREESYRMCKELLEKKKEILGEHDASTLLTEHTMALVLFDLEEFNEAYKIINKVLDSRKKFHPQNQEEINITKHNLALVLHKKAEIDKAIEINKEVLEWVNSHLGESHPRTLATRQNIPTCFYEQKKFSKAKEEFEKVLHCGKKVLGEEHPRTILTKYWIGVTLQALGEKEEALKILEHVLKIRTRDLGETHPDTIHTQSWILYLKTKQTEKTDE